MIDRGKIIIISMFLVAIAMGGYAWWFHYQISQRCLQLWGTEAAVLIRNAPTVRLLLLREGSASEDQESLEVDGRTLVIAERRDLIANRDLARSRSALLQDPTFLWDEEPGGCEPNWDFALRFIDGERQATMAFDIGCHRAWLVERGKFVAMTPVIKNLGHFVKGEPIPVDE